jgi:hypothetical protein
MCKFLRQSEQELRIQAKYVHVFDIRRTKYAHTQMLAVIANKQPQKVL